MDNERKRMLFLGIILGTILIMSIGFMAFNKFLNKGTVSVSAEPPFVVEVVNGGVVQCVETPCRIGTKRGFQNLIITKANHKSVVREVDVKLWKTQELAVSLELIPQIFTATTLPADSTPSYSLVYDQDSRLYKLIADNDRQANAIVNFPKEIKNAQVFSADKSALIIGDSTAYRISIPAKTKTALSLSQTLANITNTSLSRNGTHFSFRYTSGADLHVLTGNTIQQTDLIADRTATAWTYDERLLFITNQELLTTTGTDLSGNPYVELGDQFSTTGYYVGFYDPANDKYSRIGSFTEITSLPTAIVPTSNGRTIYLQVGDNIYRIVLQ